MAHKYHDVILAWLDGEAIQYYNCEAKGWETWDAGFYCTPPFGSGEWRIQPKKSPVEEAGITKEDLLAYFDEQNLSNDRNGLILRVHKDDGTDIPRCKVVVGNGLFTKEDLLWCDLSNMRKIFP
jgi:hypothetical protein